MKDYRHEKMPRMALAEFRLWGAKPDQPFCFICNFCGDQIAAFNERQCMFAIQAVIGHYLNDHVGLIVEKEL